MHVVLLPIPFLAPAILVEYLLNQNLLPTQNILGISQIVRPFRILCYGCLCLNAFYLHILRGKPLDDERPRDEVGELPQRMLRRLRMVGSTLRSVCSICGVSLYVTISAVCASYFPLSFACFMHLFPWYKFQL